MAFFLEATFVGLFFFGWDGLSKVGHLSVTWLVAIGSNLSAFWILVANAWMQNPVGSQFNYQTMRLEMTSFYDVIFNPVAQSKFVHTVSACYVTGAVFVKVSHPTWRTVWDYGLFLAGFVPSLVFGIAFGNILQGVPFHFDETLRSFYTGGFLDLFTRSPLFVGC